MHTEALFKGPTLFRIFTRKYHWQQNDLKSIFFRVFWRETITRTINNLKYLEKINTYQEKFLSKNWCFFYVSLLAGNFTVEKKVCTFELCLALIKKYSKSFGGKNLASSTRFFFSSKAMDIFCFNTRLCSNSQKFFSFRQPSIRKKKEKR